MRDLERSRGELEHELAELRQKAAECEALEREYRHLQDLVGKRELELRKAGEKEVARLDRLNLIGEMAAGIAHEIRNPMTTVRGFLQLLGDKQECSAFSHYLDMMILELDRANAIITEFLFLAKDRAVDLKETSLTGIVEAMLPLLRADAIKSDCRIEAELGNCPGLLVDEKEIRQLILNLVKNGIEAMPGGGIITIRTFMDNGEVVLAVQDRGSGIKPEVMEKIGTPFFTTKDGGTGLGLAVCYSIAERHNARVEVETGGGGTTFYVRFKGGAGTAGARRENGMR
ncbi:MAG: hypothetical protein K6T80_05140 [Firmicutes bacterium]|nr:hypothetical protein [Bacillota bacterium]